VHAVVDGNSARSGASAVISAGLKPRSSTVPFRQPLLFQTR
jgi:hypothetical protein